MRRRALTLASLGIVSVLAFASTAVAGGRSHGSRPISGSIVGVYPVARPAIAPSFPHSSFSRPRLHRHARFATVGVPVAYAAPPAFYEAPAYSEPPVVTAPALSTPLPASPPPPPQGEVIQHSDGRYELRGDGGTRPYRWVWIPNPPPPPKPARDTRLYGWIDEHGALHVTDRWDAIPQQYRAQAKRNQSS